MQEITVISDTPDIELQTTDDAPHFIDALIAAGWPRPLADAAVHMQLDEIQRVLLLDYPAIPELIARRLLQLGLLASTTARNGTLDSVQWNTLCVPIILRDSEPQFISPKTIEPALMVSAHSATAHAGTTARTHSVTARPIKIRYDRPIYALAVNAARAGDAKLTDYIAAANEELAIVGLVINAPTVPAKRPRALGLSLSTTQWQPISYVSTGTTLFAPDETIQLPYHAGSRVPQFAYKLRGLGASGQSGSGHVDAAVFRNIFNYFVDCNRAVDVVASTIVVATADTYPPRAMVIQAATPPLSKILQMLQELHYGAFNSTYAASVWADVIGRGFYAIYVAALWYGADSAAVQAKIQQYKQHTANARFYQAAVRAQMQQRVLAATYEQIIEQKFKPARVAQIYARVRPPRQPDALLHALDPQERKLVLAEQTAREKYISAVAANKCPHVKLVRRLRSARELADQRRVLTSTLQYADAQTRGAVLAAISTVRGDRTRGERARGDGAQTDAGRSVTLPLHQIACAVCKFDLICPHVLLALVADLAGWSFDQTHSALAKYIATTRGGDSHCAVCYEVVRTNTLDLGADTAHMDPDIKKQLWSEAAQWTKYLKIDASVDRIALVTAVRDSTYASVFDIDKQLIKSKTATLEQLQNRRKLYMAVYTLAAYIIQAEGSNATVQFRGLGAKPSTVELIKHGIGLIMSAKNIILRDLAGVTYDTIKTNLVAAYKLLKSGGGELVIAHGDKPTLLELLAQDPVFWYAAYRAVFSNALVPGTTDRITAKTAASVLNYAFYDSDSTPAVTPAERIARKGKKRGGARTPVDALPDDLFAHVPLVDDRANTTPPVKYAAESYNLFWRGRPLVDEKLYIDKSAAGDFTNVELTAPYAAQHAAYAEIRALECALLLQNARESAPMYLRKRVSQTRAFVPASDGASPALHRVYDENGIKHKWTKYAIAATADAPADVPANITTLSGLIAAVDAAYAHAHATVYVKRVCAVCGITHDNTSTLNDEKIQASLRARSQVANFYKFYETRCLAGGLHEINSVSLPGRGDGVTACAKCSIQLAFMADPYARAAIDFYRANARTYDADRRAPSQHVQSPHVQSPHLQSQYAVTEPSPTAWTFNFNKIVELAQLLKLNERQLTALGAYEAQDPAAILAGTYIPTETEYRFSTRVFVVDAHIKNMITEYNQIRWFARGTAKPAPALVALLDASGIAKVALPTVLPTLPDIYGEYNRAFADILRTRKPREIVDFCIQSLCEMLLALWHYKDAPAHTASTKKLRRAFVEYAVAHILRNEEMLTKPGQFNWVTAFGDKPAAMRDINFIRDADPGEGERQEDDDTGTTDMPFADEFDVDKEPEETGDEEEDQNYAAVDNDFSNV